MERLSNLSRVTQLESVLLSQQSQSSGPLCSGLAEFRLVVMVQGQIGRVSAQGSLSTRSAGDCHSSPSRGETSSPKGAARVVHVLVGYARLTHPSPVQKTTEEDAQPPAPELVPSPPEPEPGKWTQPPPAGP